MNRITRDLLIRLAESLEICAGQECDCKGCMNKELSSKTGCDRTLKKAAASALRKYADEEGIAEKEELVDFKGAAWQAGLYERAIRRYGEKAQVLKAIEELGELSVELARWLNSDEPADGHLLANIREELADVCIMTDQLQLIFDDVSSWEVYKLERLERRLEAGL